MNTAKSNTRPTLKPDEIDQAINRADLTDIESEIIEYIRYIGVFNELSLKKALSMPTVRRMQPFVLIEECLFDR